MVLEPVDPNSYYRERRRKRRRRQRLRKLGVVVLTLLAALTTAAAIYVRTPSDDRPQASASRVAAEKPAAPAPAAPRPLAPRPPPLSMRGVHVTMPLASIPGKLDEYFAMRGLNALQLDLKDESGEVAFSPPTVPLAGKIGAARGYYVAPRVGRQARRHGVYLIGRIVCFQDPVLAEQRPALALKRRDGSIWENNAGHRWVSPYRREVWKYIVDVAVAAAKRGFDEIQFDYVRFPSDGDITQIVYPGRTSKQPGWVIAEFLHYARKRLKPLGVRVSADVFGLSATRDIGVAQVPRRISRYLDAIYPMVYPSHYHPGEYGLDDPNAAPGRTVAASLADFTRELAGRDTDLIPWLQDFSLGRTYTLADVQAQIDAAAAAGAAGYLLWNPLGVYTAEALTYEPAPSGG